MGAAPEALPARLASALWLWVAALGVGSSAYAASVGSESSIGLAADYNSNPLLLGSEPKSAASEAVLINVPVTYNGDELTADLTPRLRFAQTQGIVGLLSNYQYLDADAKWVSERDTFSAGADWHHDSTLYNPFENAALIGRTLRRQEELANLGWEYQLSERLDFQLLASWDRLVYATSAYDVLSSYQYSEGSAELDYNFLERWQWTTAAGYGLFQLIGQSYRSDQEFATTGLTRKFTERWSLKAQVGYSRLREHETFGFEYCAVASLFCYLGFYPFQFVHITEASEKGTTNGAFTLQRQYERASLSLSASRTITPSGLGILATEDDVSVSGSYDWSERWSSTVTLRGARLSDTLGHLSLGNRSYGDLDLTASWQWTEHLLLQLGGTLALVRYNAQHANSGAVQLSLFRQFGRVRLD